MGAIDVMLTALKYPRSASFNAHNEAECRALLLWLENTKIRQYKVEERAFLRPGSDASMPWSQLLAKYLGDADCPMDVEQASTEDVFRWLLAYAVDLEYADNAEALNQKGAELQPPQVQGRETGPREVAPFPDVGSVEVQQQLQQLLHMLQLQAEPTTLPQQLQAALQLLQDQALPLASMTQHAGSTASSASVLASLPLGFSTGDDRVDLAATVLRLLHVRQLRHLQTQIDHAIVAVQEYTANPKTDSRLGKVGH